MSYKTQRLVDLFPDVYATGERESVLHKVLDAVGAELMAADEQVKALLKSHWVDYASGGGLDGLGAVFGVERRRLPGGALETDAAFRLRLKSVVPLFTGGGTRRAVLGAVRSALGFPFDLDRLGLPPHHAALRRDLEGLVTLVEFSPKAERLVDAVDDPAAAGALELDVPVVSIRAERPQIRWTFTRGAGRRLRLERRDAGTGLLADDALVVPEGATLRLTPRADGRVRAFVGTQDVTAYFTALDGGAPLLPEVPRTPSRWRFTAEGALFDASTFDEADTFDAPLFGVEMAWRSYEPLTFDVYVPYFLKQAVDSLKAQHRYPGALFVYEGLDLRTIQRVVDQTRAAGVRGSVHFSLDFREVHDVAVRRRREGFFRHREDAGAEEAMTAANSNQLAETHDVTDRLTLGGVFNTARFDSPFVFT